ncbi:hypothetical protein ABT390_30180 [Streptomyces aurantiacus]|uniref:hypothetical protein n=1 Tax=Streptomyces aurantiacus TaxID=47760 RepID=UPI00131A2CE9|nr:hypothetical protein [Streptomyces aurantiacus]
MRIRTAIVTVALAAAAVLGSSSAASANDPDPGNHDGATGIGLNLLCGLGVLGSGSCDN